MEDRLSSGVLAACHKLGQGDRVRSLPELNKSANVSDKKTKGKNKIKDHIHNKV
jgi:hypothetical protein